MAEGKKISELIRLSALDGTESLPLAKGGSNYQTSISDVVKFLGGNSKATIASDLKVGNTVLGDALLEVDNNHPIVQDGYLIKSSGTLKAGTPYDILFGALLYADEVILEPTNVQKQNADISFTNGSVVIGEFSKTSCYVGDEVTFKVTVRGGTINVTKAKVYNLEFGYFESKTSTTRRAPTAVENTLSNVETGYGSVGTPTVSVKNGTDIISCSMTEQNGGVFSYKFKATKTGTYTITATVTDRVHAGGTIESITVYPSDSSLKNIAATYANGVTAEGKTVTNLGGSSLTAPNQTVTAENAAILQVVKAGETTYSDTYLDYVGSSFDIAGNKDKDSYLTVETASPATTKAWTILIPSEYSNTTIKVWKWVPTSSSWAANSSTFTLQEGEYTYEGRKYKQYVSKHAQLAQSEYCVKIVKQ